MVNIISNVQIHPSKNMKKFAPSVYDHLKRMFHPFEWLINDKGEQVIIIEQIRLSKGEYVHSKLYSHFGRVDPLF